MEEEEATLVVTVKDKLCVLKLSRPHKKNALRSKEYRALMTTLYRIAEDPDVAVVAVTGEGDYFTSGNDFSHVLQNISIAELDNDGGDCRVDLMSAEGAVEEEGSARLNIVQDFITCLIDFPKPLVAVLNGPAVGIGVTMLGHFDLVYASDKATFHTPFVNLGLMAEGCSSYIFPRLMGLGKAAEVLLFGKKLSAEEACDQGLVTQVVPHSHLHQVWPQIHEYAKLPPNTLLAIKNVIRVHDREMLHKVNAMEMEWLKKTSGSEETIAGIMNMLAKKSRL